MTNVRREKRLFLTGLPDILTMNQLAVRVRNMFLYCATAVVLLAAIGLTWLRWDSHLPRDQWLSARLGTIEQVVQDDSVTDGQGSSRVTLVSDTGLSVSLRIVRHLEAESLPVLLVLGGHETGRDAVDLFGDVGRRAVVAMDYPYDGPEKVRGLATTLRTIPPARKALLDTTPAVSLLVDWLAGQPWVDTGQIVIVGVSLGVPFAAAAAARDERITGALLVHGAADNLVWLETQVARRIDSEFLHRPLSTILYWLAYGPLWDTSAHVAQISPRPVLIIGARNDERAPPGQTELLYAAARKPKSIRWSGGRHVQPGRSDVVQELLRILNEELPLQGGR